MTLVLASSSPRRRELLTQLLFSSPLTQFEIVSPDIDETHFENEATFDFVNRLAQQKAQAGFKLSQQFQNPVVLGSDTIVVINGMILGKPASPENASEMLEQLSGKKHQVLTAVAVTNGEKMESSVIQTEVTFRKLSKACINDYVKTGEPLDKAGSYGIQGLGGTFVSKINGSYSAVVGLPMTQTYDLLKTFISI